MDPTDITHDILRKIQADLAELRGETRANGRRLDEVNARLDGVNNRLDGQGRRIDEATGRVRAVERRIGELVEITGRSVTQQIDLGRRVESLEDRVDALERRASPPGG